MRDPRFDPLFQPLKIGPVTAPNRFWQVPHCTGMGSQHPANMAAMAEAVHAHGVLAGVELWHGGGSTNALSRAIGVGPESWLAEKGPWQDQRMDRQDIRTLRDWHRAAALRARAAGFDLVYVYAAHSYLLAQFLAPALNRRTDNYGGSFDNRTRIVPEILDDTRDAVDDRAAIAIPIEVTDPDGSGIAARNDFLGRIAPLVDVFDVTIPDYDTEMGPSRLVKEAALEAHVAHVRTAAAKPVVSVGRFTSPETMLSQLRRGILDFIGAAKPSIADPFLPAKIRDGRTEDTRECIGCNICYAHHRLAAPIRCTQNPTMGEEWRQGWQPEHVPPIIGQADPAGLEAAVTLGKRGASVVLAEAGEPGGRVTREARLPGLSEWGRVIDWRLSLLAKLPQVTLYPGSKMTPDDIRETGLSHVMIATGSLWRADGRGRSLPGGEASYTSPRTLTPDQVLDGARPPQGPVVVFDNEGYHIAAGLADLLASEGFEIKYVTPAGTVASWAYFTAEQSRLQARPIERGVTIRTGQYVSTLGPETARLTCVHTGRTGEIPCSSFIPVTSREPQDGLWDAGLRSLVRIGDARAPGVIAHAIHDAHGAARAHLTRLPPPRRERPILSPTLC
jgi:dimethylamine/trimethylamine dehydrogenase